MLFNVRAAWEQDLGHHQTHGRPAGLVRGPSFVACNLPHVLHGYLVVTCVEWVLTRSASLLALPFLAALMLSRPQGTNSTTTGAAKLDIN